MRFPTSPHSLRYLLFSDFLITFILASIHPSGIYRTPVFDKAGCSLQNWGENLSIKELFRRFSGTIAVKTSMRLVTGDKDYQGEKLRVVRESRDPVRAEEERKESVCFDHLLCVRTFASVLMTFWAVLLSCLLAPRSLGQEVGRLWAEILFG